MKYILFLSLLLCQSCISIESNLTYEEAIRLCSTPQDVQRMVKRYIHYSNKVEDYLQTTGEEVWASKKGTCESFAIIVHDMCRRIGFDSEILYLQPQNIYRQKGRIVYSKHLQPSHVVVVGVLTKDKMWMVSNGDWYTFKVYSVDKYHWIKSWYGYIINFDPDRINIYMR